MVETHENKERLKFYQNDIILFEPEQLIFIDEMGVNENITRTYARSQRGTRAKKFYYTWD